jgi:hypothetical protein
MPRTVRQWLVWLCMVAPPWRDTQRLAAVTKGRNMNIQTLDTKDPKAHVRNIEQALGELINHVRADVDRVDEPKAQVLFETSAEVLTGLRTAYQHYASGVEKTMR